MIKKVLVVGGAGYVGGCITDELIKRKIPFTVYDNLTYEERYLKDLDFIFGDIRDRGKLKKLFPRYSHVIWLAAIVGDGAGAIDPNLTYEINFKCTLWLARNFKGRILFPSTCAVYGFNEKVVNEGSSLNPLSDYAKSKVKAEKALKYNNCLIFRIGTAFGLGDGHSRIRMDLGVNLMSVKAATKGELVVFGGKQWRPFVHVKEIAKAFVDNLDNTAKGIYNLTMQNLRLIDVAKEIKKQTGCKIELKTQDSPGSYNTDPTRGIKNKLFTERPKYDISYGVSEMIALANFRKVRNFDDDRFSNEKYLRKIIKEYKKY